MAAAAGTAADVGAGTGAGAVIGDGQGSALVFTRIMGITVIRLITPTLLIHTITPIQLTLPLPQQRRPTRQQQLQAWLLLLLRQRMPTRS